MKTTPVQGNYETPCLQNERRSGAAYLIMLIAYWILRDQEQ